jgi:hypothetical protein
MLPLILAGVGLISLLAGAFSDDDSGEREKGRKKKIFISFAIEDQKYRDFLVAQAKNGNSPFDFVDMSAKEPWEQSVWKEKCRAKIKKCDGMIVLLSKNTFRAGGARWEIKCAKEEGIKLVGMHIQKNNKGAVPPELKGKKVITWQWDKIEEFVTNL